MRYAAWIVLLCSAAANAAPAVPFKSLPNIKFYADVSPAHLDTGTNAGTIVELTSKPGDQRVDWNLVVLDAKHARHTYSIVLPPTVALPLAKGATIAIDSGLTGGGPNTRGRIAITDDHGGLVLAIGRLPAGWTADTGTQQHVDKSSTYDEHDYAVLIHAPDGATAELVDMPWRDFKLAGQRYIGNGNAASRELHVPTPPPDYVPSWIDYVIVRAP
jgi:hypothetical protein